MNNELYMVKLKLWLEAFVCSYMPQILAFSFSLVILKFSIHNFFETKVLYSLWYQPTLHSLSVFQHNGGLKTQLKRVSAFLLKFRLVLETLL